MAVTVVAVSGQARRARRSRPKLPQGDKTRICTPWLSLPCWLFLLQLPVLCSH